MKFGTNLKCHLFNHAKRKQQMKLKDELDMSKIIDFTNKFGHSKSNRLRLEMFQTPLVFAGTQNPEMKSILYTLTCTKKNRHYKNRNQKNNVEDVEVYEAF